MAIIGAARPFRASAQASGRAVTFHDPLAATTIFRDDICAFTRGHVDVELLSGRVLAMTHWSPDIHGSHEVALTVDKERFFEHYFSTLGA
jgi:purine nucleosidase